MMNVVILLAVLLSTQQPAATQPGGNETPVLRAGLGPCLANFTVVDAGGMPVYAASINVRLRYGMMSLKRMDLEVSTDQTGRANFQGLPKNGRKLRFTVARGNIAATVEQDLKTSCDSTHKVTLK